MKSAYLPPPPKSKKYLYQRYVCFTPIFTVSGGKNAVTSIHPFTAISCPLQLKKYLVHNLLIVIGSLRFTKSCWIGKHTNISMKPTKLPNRRPTQANPRKIRLKVAFEPPFFPPAKKKRILSWDWFYIGNRPHFFIYETDYNKPNPIKLSANTLFHRCMLSYTAMSRNIITFSLVVNTLMFTIFKNIKRGGTRKGTKYVPGTTYHAVPK